MDQSPQKQTKPGYKTTEFWVTMVTLAVGLGLLAYGVVSGNNTAVAVGAGLSGVQSAGYSASRGLAKK